MYTAVINIKTEKKVKKQAQNIARDLNFRRLNEAVLLQKYQYNSTDKIEMLKSLFCTSFAF